MDAETPTRRGERARRSRSRLTVVGVIGELLVTAGVIVLLFLGWQLWFTEWTVGNAERAEANEQTQAWNDEAANAPEPTPSETPTDEPTIEPDPSLPLTLPVQAAPGNASTFGMLIVPRWGADYYRTIAEGVGTSDVLDRGKLGHYPSTQMPGEVGNFAIAAHRMGNGGSLHHIHELRLGDHIYVETSDGWYRYAFRNLEYVQPTGVGVLDAVPQAPGVPSDERYITLTSCNPMHTTAERIIAYGLLDGFFPRDTSVPGNGAPEEIRATVDPAGSA